MAAVKGPNERGMILTGVVLAVITSVVVLAVVALPVIGNSNTPGNARSTACLSMLKQNGTALFLYCGEHNDRFPHRDAWMEASKHYSRSYDPDKSDWIVHCPQLKPLDPSVFGYAFNSVHSLKPVPQKGAELSPLVYDSLNLGPNASDPYLSLPPFDPTSGQQRRNVRFADGHAKRNVPGPSP
jgi:hypothetical protein